MNYQFIKKSSNAKVGAIPVTNSNKNTCPDSCPLKDNGCYASAGFYTRLNWDKVTSGERGGNWGALIDSVNSLKDGQLWRHNVSGDLPHNNGKIDQVSMIELIEANMGKRGFTYTHHEATPDNLDIIEQANRNGFTVNLSANNIEQAIEYKETGLPVVTVLPMDAPNDQTIEGVRVVACPAEKSDSITCKTCQLCSKADRDYVIGFRAHGSQKNAANLIATVEMAA